MSIDWRDLPVGAWFFCDSPQCTDRYSVQQRTHSGCSIVCSTPYVHDGAKKDMQDIAETHNRTRHLKLEARAKLESTTPRKQEQGKQ